MFDDAHCIHHAAGSRTPHTALAIHRQNTQTPIAKLRIFSGKISASSSQTRGPMVACMQNTKRTTNSKMK